MAVVLGKYNHEVWDKVGERSSRGLKLLVHLEKEMENERSK